MKYSLRIWGQKLPIISPAIRTAKMAWRRIELTAQSEPSAIQKIAEVSVLCTKIMLRKKAKYIALFSIPFVGIATCSIVLIRDCILEIRSEKHGHGDEL